jgi:hypothetical protein
LAREARKAEERAAAEARVCEKAAKDAKHTAALSAKPEDFELLDSLAAHCQVTHDVALVWLRAVDFEDLGLQLASLVE